MNISKIFHFFFIKQNCLWIWKKNQLTQQVSTISVRWIVNESTQNIMFSAPTITWKFFHPSDRRANDFFLSVAWAFFDTYGKKSVQNFSEQIQMPWRITKVFDFQFDAWKGIWITSFRFDEFYKIQAWRRTVHSFWHPLQ